MGKSTYRPKRNNEKTRNEARVRREDMGEENSQTVYDSEDVSSELEQEEQVKEKINTEKTIVISKGVNSKESKSIQNIKEVGDIDCEYHIFIEDYVYTYIYQLAKANTNKELSTILVGEVYKESKEAVIRGIIPINMDKLKEETEWIDANILDDVEEARVEYFEDQNIIGWMHLQPGYGTMLTMKEQREHSDIFEGDGSICMLIDPINKIESIFVYEGNELKEQSGFCMYYERNEAMQRYMLEHSFDNVTKEEMKDNIVTQFREIGKVRKAEYTQRKNLNLAVMIVSTVLIVITAIMVKVYDQKRENNSAQIVSGQSIDNQTGDQLNNYVDSNITNTSDNMNESSEAVLNQENQFVKEVLDESNENESVVAEKDVEPQVTKEVDEEENKDVEINSSKTDDPKIEKEVKEEMEVDHIYVVKKGQTLANIAYDIYGDAKKSLDIAKFNNLENTNEIYYGQELKIPRID